jgi:hypothetical protein
LVTPPTKPVAATCKKPRRVDLIEVPGSGEFPEYQSNQQTEKQPA